GVTLPRVVVQNADLLAEPEVADLLRLARLQAAAVFDRASHLGGEVDQVLRVSEMTEAAELDGSGAAARQGPVVVLPGQGADVATQALEARGAVEGGSAGADPSRIIDVVAVGAQDRRGLHLVAGGEVAALQHRAGVVRIIG